MQVFRRSTVLTAGVLLFSALVRLAVPQSHMRSGAHPAKQGLPSSAQALPRSTDSCLTSFPTDTQARKRAWCIWAALTAGANAHSDFIPQWMQAPWVGEPKDGMENFPCPVTRPSRLLPLKDLPELRTTDEGNSKNGVPMIASVYFNEAAVNEICNGLAPNLILPAGNADCNESNGIPRRLCTAIVVNAPLPKDPASNFPVIVKIAWAASWGDGLNVPFRVWTGNYEQGTDLSLKNTATLTNNSTCNFHGALTPESGLSIPKSCLFTASFMNVSAPSIPTTITVGGSASNPGFTLIALAVNVAARSKNGWTWQTFNWSGGPDQEEQALRADSADNPYRLLYASSPWKTYTMHASGDANHARLYSPYLEHNVANEADSKCLSCHQNAKFYLDTTVATCVFCANQDGGGTGEASCTTPSTPARKRDADNIWNVALSNVPRVNGSCLQRSASANAR